MCERNGGHTFTNKLSRPILFELCRQPYCFSRFYKPEKFSQDFKSRYREFRLCVIEHCWNRATKYIPFSFRQAFSKRIHGGGLAFPLYQLDFLIFFLSPNLLLLECSHVALRFSDKRCSLLGLLANI